MMPMPPGRGPRRVYLDANAAIDYVREWVLHDLDLPPTAPELEILRSRLAQTHNVFVSKTARREAGRNLQNDLMREMRMMQKRGDLDPLKADRVMGKAWRYLRDYFRAKGCNDLLDYVPAAREMYSSIRTNPNKRKFFKWMAKKSVNVAVPVLGSENDLRILSTAAHHAQRHVVELWTHDMDFTMFADEIGESFGVKVVDSHRLGG